MYVGHELLAIGLAAGLARAAGLTRRRALLLGGLGGVYAFVPDLDLAYTIWAILAAGPTEVFPTTEHVWTKSWIVHRSLTHSLVTGAVTVLAVGVFARTLRRYRADGIDRYSSLGLTTTIAAIGILAWVVLLSDELLGLLTLGLYLTVALATAAWATTRELPTPQLMGVAAIGLLTHPIGDVFTGRPPTFLYPFLSSPPFGKIVVAVDPTVNLIALFALELGLAWFAVLTVISITGQQLRPQLRPRAILGLGFAASVTVIQPPTLEVAYHFAIGTIATGAVLGAGPASLRTGWRRSPREALTEQWAPITVTALAGATLAVCGYLFAYLIIGGP